MRIRRTFRPEFIANEVLEIISGKKSVGETCWKYKFSPIMMSEWRTEIIENSANTFGSIIKELKAKNKLLILDAW